MGHGNTKTICISGGSGCRDYVGYNLYIRDKTGNNGKLDDLLRNKMSPSGLIKLEGCNNASGDNNITKTLSERLPSISVRGGNGYQLGYENHWLWGNTSGSLGFKKTYKNGVEVP